MTKVYKQEKFLDFYRKAANGTLAGIEPVTQFGKNTDVGDASKEVLIDNGGLYNWLDSYQILNIESTSSNDTLNGTGAQKIKINGLTNSGITNEIVEMNGTNTVQTTNEFFRVFDFRVVQSGSNRVNDGEITVSDNTSSQEIIEIIPSGQGKSHSATYTICGSYSGVALGWFGSERSKNGVTIEIWIRDNNNNVSYVSREATITGGNFEREFSLPLYLPGGTDIAVRAISAQSGAYVSGGIFGYIIHDDVKEEY